MTTQTERMREAMKEAFMEGYTRHTTYNDIDLSNPEDEWEKAAPSLLVLTQPEQPAAQKWLSIETAPKDGTTFLGFKDGRIAEAYLVPRDDCEMWSFGNTSGAVEFWPNLKPTHWMPLPAPPMASPPQAEQAEAAKPCLFESMGFAPLAKFPEVQK